eukprot:m.109667 g.109667  ORF g.109667 m.109667 type:complete len:541 (-) comp9205_c2_seq1:201-1823(-)
MDVMKGTTSAVFHACRSMEGLNAILADEYMLDVVKMSVGYALKKLLTMEVFLLDKLSSTREVMPEVAALVFVEPSRANLEVLESELNDPKYSVYSIYFSRAPPDDSFLNSLAAADVFQRVRRVEVLFLNFLPIDDKLFSLSLPRLISPARHMRPSSRHYCVEGVVSLCASLKIKPRVRFQQSSSECEVIANHINTLCTADTYDKDSLLLVLDRRMDVVTPLLVPWTYRAMVHDFFGIVKNIIDTSSLTETIEDRVFSAAHDLFLKHHKDSHIADVVQTVPLLKRDMKQFAQLREDLKSTTDVAAMAKIVDQIPALKDKNDIAAKHLKILIEVNEFYKKNNIHVDDDTSMLLLQLRVCVERKGIFLKELKKVLAGSTFRHAEKLRLALLFAAKHNAYAETSKLLQEFGLDQFCSTIDALQQYYGDCEAKRLPYNAFQLVAKASAFNKDEAEYGMFAHAPLLAHILQDLKDEKLSATDFPGCDMAAEKQRIKKLVVFIVGGATYEEAKIVSRFSEITGIDTVLGGSMIHNFDSFCDDIGSSK